VGYAVAPADLRLKAAVVAHAGQVGGGGGHQLLSRHRRQVGLAAVDARHFGKDQRGKRAGKALRVRRLQVRQQGGAQRLHGGGGQLLVAHPRRQRFEGDLVTQHWIWIGQALDQVQGQLLAARIAWHLPLGCLQGQQLATLHATGAAGGAHATYPQAQSQSESQSDGEAHIASFPGQDCGDEVELVRNIIAAQRNLSPPGVGLPAAEPRMILQLSETLAGVACARTTARQACCPSRLLRFRLAQLSDCRTDGLRFSSPDRPLCPPGYDSRQVAHRGGVQPYHRGCGALGMAWALLSSRGC
jgi:hypothetical protein